MRPRQQVLAILLAASGAPALAQDAGAGMPSVIINGGRPSSLPVQIPTTIETIRAEQIEQRINAFDSEDALKYFPSLNVRKRYIGDHDHAVLSSRASGTGNSARSLVYADGILLSNLLGNGATFTPRWGMVSPEEIERVDVLYGPFSAAYPGNSVGAVVDFQTRMPRELEAHLKLAGFSQGYDQYASRGRARGAHGSASIGNRVGAWSWWGHLARLDSNSQPIGFATRLTSAGQPGTGGVPVQGAVPGESPAAKPWLVLGSTSQGRTVQDHAKVKLAYEFSPVLRASYTLGWWANDTDREARSYLRDAAGNAVYGGSVNIGGARYDLRPADFAPTTSQLTHLIHGLSLKQFTRGVWDWELAATQYDYRTDLQGTPTVMVPHIGAAGAGRVTNMGGSGWHALSAKAIWRPNPAHVVEMGYQDNRADLESTIRSSADWRSGEGDALVSRFTGSTRLQSLFAQDGWRVAPQLKATLGARLERWRAYDGSLANGVTVRRFDTRSETSWSPKAALAYEVQPGLNLKASVGRAVRNPTASELFQGQLAGDEIVNTDPTLRAEKSWTGELTAERTTLDSVLRSTFFHESTRDALYSQPLTTLVNTVQNIGRVRTSGVELAWQGDHVFIRGLTLNASTTYAHSKIAQNPAFPASAGKRQPRVPNWRANALATYAPGERWSGTFGVRYSGEQFGTLDNTDPNGAAWTGVSRYLVMDARVRYRFNRQWSVALGVDNLNNESYWAFHPYPQRTAVAELRFDL